MCIGYPNGYRCEKPTFQDIGIGSVCERCLLLVLGSVRNDEDVWLTAGLLGAAEETILREKRRREANARNKRTQGFVAAVGELVKIGASVDPKVHVARLGPDARLLLTYENGQKVERALSRRFKHLSIGGRLYDPDEDMKTWINTQCQDEVV